MSSASLNKVSRGMVVVKGWHTETFSSARLANAPEIFRFVEPQIFEHASRTFGQDGPLLKVLVVPALPAGKEAQTKSIELLREKGIDAVIPFRTMLEDLVETTEVDG